MSTLKARPCDELIIRSTPEVTPCAKQKQNWVLAACVLGSSMAFIDSSVVNVALPKMESSGLGKPKLLYGEHQFTHFSSYKARTTYVIGELHFRDRRHSRSEKIRL